MSRWPPADTKVTDTGASETGPSRKRQVLPRTGSREAQTPWTTLFSGCSWASQEDGADETQHSCPQAGRPTPTALPAPRTVATRAPGHTSTLACTTGTQETSAGQTWKKLQLWGSRPQSRNRNQSIKPATGVCETRTTIQAVGKKTAALLSPGPRSHPGPHGPSIYSLSCEDSTDRKRRM